VTADVVDGRSALLAGLLAAGRRTALQHSHFAQAVATQLGIGPTDLECLLLLRELGSASAGQLAEVLGLTTGAITGVVDRLAVAGFVVRESDPSDRRRVIVQPVAEQARRLDQLFAPLLALLAEWFGQQSDASLSEFIDCERRVSAVLEHETGRLRAEQAGTGGLVAFSAPLGGLDSACLEFASGASDVRIVAADASTDELYRGTFEGIQPSVRLQAGTVTVRYKRMGLFEWGAARHAGTVALNPRIPWTIVLRGGAVGVDLDLRGMELRGLSVEGGASKLEVWLPAPRGNVSVCLDGGANRLQIQHPAGACVQLQVRGGANRLEFDAQRFGAVGGDVRLASPGWELAADRYAIEVRGGASRLTVQEAS
jgi:DNA-binding MarR family transcriptional regulator